MEWAEIIREGGLAALATVACVAVVFLARAYLALQKQYHELASKSVRATTESVKTLESISDTIQSNGTVTQDMRKDLAKSLDLLKSVKETAEKVNERVIELKAKQEI